jgi:acyl-CoA thioester hydrolase
MPKLKQRPERGLFVEHSIPVRTYDIDYAGHVSNIAYLRWFEDMRSMLFDKYFPLQMFMDEGKTPVIASHYVQYKRPIKLFDKPHAVMWISEVANASMFLNAEVTVRGQVVTAVEHVGVFIDLKTGKPIRMPEICVRLFREASEPLPALPV